MVAALVGGGHPAAKTHPKATHQWLLMSVQACRLPALKPLKPLKTLKTLKTPKTLKTLNGRPGLPFASPYTPSQHLAGMSCTHMGAHIWAMVAALVGGGHPVGVQACRLPALKPLKPLKTFKTLKTPKIHKALNGRPGLPFASPYTPSQHLAGMSCTHMGAHIWAMVAALVGGGHPAANRHPKATHQWLLMSVQACRLPALKPLKPLKTLKILKTPKTLKTLNGRPGLPFASPYTPSQHLAGMSCTHMGAHIWAMVAALVGGGHPAANRHPKATHQWLLMGVQACRLPALKPLKPLKTLKTLKTPKTVKTLHGHPGLPSRHVLYPYGRPYLGNGCGACRGWSSCSQQAPQGYTSMASYGRPGLPFASP